MGILLLLVDGLGLGEPDADRNPMAVAQTRWFRCFRRHAPATDGCAVVPTDASLGVPGLPQSATGQTAMLTGLNAPLLAGRHVQGFCTPTLASMLQTHSLFRMAWLSGGRVTCANAFTESTLRRQRFPSVTTVALRSAGIPLRDLTDLTRGEALYHDFTNDLLRAQGHAVPLLSSDEAARRLAAITEAHDLTYYEYIQTDLAGHAQNMDRAVNLLEGLDAFVSTVVASLDLSRHLCVLVSDHGNIEDLSSPSHTWNRVPTMAWGRGKAIFARQIQALTDIAPALLAALQAARQQSAVSRQQSALRNEDLVPFADR